MKISKRLLHAGCIALVLAANGVMAQAWPSKPIRLVAPFPPGSSIDIIARLLAQPMSESLGVPIVVENKTGAGGNIGVDAVVKSPKDGYTIGIGARGPLAINGYLVDNLSYDPVKDVAPIALFGSSAIVFWVSADFPAKSMQEFVAIAKALEADHSQLIDLRSTMRNRFAQSTLGNAAGLTQELEDAFELVMQRYVDCPRFFDSSAESV